MPSINKQNATIRYYTGVIRDLRAQLQNAIARIKKLEDKIRKIPLSNPSASSNAGLFGIDDISRGGSFAGSPGGAGGGGLSSDEIKSLIIDLINNGELPIPLHDHTDNDKGGDAFGALGASLQ